MPHPTADPAASADPTPATEPTPAAEPSLAPEPSPTIKPKAKPTTSEPATDKDGRPIAAGRYIVMLSGSAANTAGVIARHGKRDGIKADRRFDASSAPSPPSSMPASARPCCPTRASSPSSPTRSSRSPARPTRPACRGSAPACRPVADIDNVDDNRVDADVAIVDTGVA